MTNPRRVNRAGHPHYAHYYLNNICVDEHGLEVPSYSNSRNTVEKIQLNHYQTKSREEFMAKVARGRADIHQKYPEQKFYDYQHDEIEDLTALKVFQSPAFRREIYQNDESTIRDLKFMLAETNPNIELLLTCFHRARSLKDQSQRERFENESLEQLFKIDTIQNDEAQLVLDTLPELLSTSTNYRKKIVDRGIELFHMLEEFYRQKVQCVEQFNYNRRRELLELLR